MAMLVSDTSSLHVQHQRHIDRLDHTGTFDTDALDALRASPDVDYIEEDGIMQLEATTTQCARECSCTCSLSRLTPPACQTLRTNAPWGLQRVSQNAKLPANSNPQALTYTFKYDSSAGAGVDIYVIGEMRCVLLLQADDHGGADVPALGQTLVSTPPT